MRLKSARHRRDGLERWSPCASSDPSCVWMFAPMVTPSMSQSRRKSAASDLKRSVSPSAKGWACASGAGRCTRPQPEGQAQVVGRLVGRAEGRKRRRGVFQLCFGQLEAVEAAARHEEQLIAAHMARGTQLALEVPALAQQARLGVAAALGGARKLRGDEREVRKIGRQLFNLVGGGEDYAQAAGAPGPGLGFSLPLIEPDDEGLGRIGARFRNIPPFIDDDLTITQQAAWHRPSP